MSEAAKPCFLAGRSRHSSAQGCAHKPVAAERHGRLLNYEGRDANLLRFRSSRGDSNGV